MWWDIQSFPSFTMTNIIFKLFQSLQTVSRRLVNLCPSLLRRNSASPRCFYTQPCYRLGPRSKFFELCRCHQIQNEVIFFLKLYIFSFKHLICSLGSVMNQTWVNQICKSQHSVFTYILNRVSNFFGISVSLGEILMGSQSLPPWQF